jgi:hypothetical protein
LAKFWLALFWAMFSQTHLVTLKLTVPFVKFAKPGPNAQKIIFRERAMNDSGPKKLVFWVTKGGNF